MDTTVEVVCPYCGEVVHVWIEVGSRLQNYQDACEVCCRPLQIEVRFDPNYRAEVQVQRSSGH